jgi:hypothetical protein
MQGWQAAPGSTLLVRSGDVFHLHFIVFGPVVLDGYGPLAQVAMVNATTLREGVPYDPACVVEAGEHAFIKHRSYLAYRHMRVDTSTHVEHMVRSGAWTARDPCSPDLLHRIAAGVCLSRLTPREYKRVFECP